MVTSEAGPWSRLVHDQGASGQGASGALGRKYGRQPLVWAWSACVLNAKRAPRGMPSCLIWKWPGC